MIRYIHADMDRISKRVPHIIAICVLAAFEIGIFLRLYFTDWSGVNFMAHAVGIIQYLPITLGLPLYISAYTEDLQAGTIYAAIGRGLSKEQVILCKLAEFILLLFRYLAGFCLILWMLTFILHPELQKTEVVLLWKMLGTEALEMARDATLAAFFVAVTHNIGIGSVLYLLFASGVLPVMNEMTNIQMGVCTIISILLIFVVFRIREL